MRVSIRKTSLAVAVAASVAFSGCATAPASQMSQAEAQWDEQSSWFSRTDVQGALVGAILGGAICAAAGGNTGTCLASAAGGAVLGYSAGAYMNSLRANYRSQEAMLGKALADIQGENQKIANYLAAERQVILEKTAKLNLLKQGLEQKTLSASAAKSELDKLKQTEEKLAKRAGDLGNVQNKWEQTYAMLNVRDQRMEREIGTMRQQIQAVKQDNENFSRQLKDVDISTVG